MKGITEAGFEYEIQDGVKSSRKFTKLLVRYNKASKESGSEMELMQINEELAETLLGKDQAEALEAFLDTQNPNGFCSQKEYDAAIIEIFTGNGDLKN